MTRQTEQAQIEARYYRHPENDAQPKPLTPPTRYEWEEIHGVLSPSQVLTYLDCSARWHYKHRVRLPDPPNANLAIGRAIHQAIAEAITDREDAGQEHSAEYMRQNAELIARKDLAAAELTDDEDAAALAAKAGAMAEAWHATSYREALPIADEHGWISVEMEVAGKFGGVKVGGRLDMVSAAGVVTDWKTAAKSPAGISQAQRLQLGTYAAIVGVSKANVTTITKAATPRVISQTFEVSVADREFIGRIYPTTAEGMDSGVIVPNRTSLLCSRKNCAFWRRCTADYGGEVS